ncbi:MAG TPA: hypothetical protein VHV10_16805 [Ktedonobacteraceae bacterium]|nr:hypothetical protein [Ktedonobacteraceae bacterium]
MREMFTSYLGKLVENTKDYSICPSAEQTAQDKETTANSLQSSRAILSGKADHPASLATEKSKKHRIPFIALALMMLFTSLCIFSVVGLRPVALADKLTHLDVTPTATPADPAEAVPHDQSVSDLLSMGNITLGYGSKCEEFRTVTGADFCWNEDDFWWGARDITCIHNPSASDHSQASTEKIQTQPSSGVATTSVDLPAALFNQNTCTNNSTCVSDNSSHNDATGSQIHSQVGGDDIVCGNNACTNVTAGGNKTECGDTTGKQRAYDRFGCQMVKSDTKTTNASTTVSSRAGSYQVNDSWDAEGIATNPTAYDPNGAFYLPTTKLSKRDIEAGSTKTRPTCGANNRWVCATDGGVIPNVVIYDFQGNFVEQKKKHEVTITDGSTIPVFWVVCDTISGG